MSRRGGMPGFARLLSAQVPQVRQPRTFHRGPERLAQNPDFPARWDAFT